MRGTTSTYRRRQRPRRPGAATFTVERLRQRHRRHPFADSAGSREDQAGRHRLPFNRAREQLQQGAVADYLTEGHRKLRRWYLPSTIAIRLLILLVLFLVLLIVLLAAEDPGPESALLLRLVCRTAGDVVTLARGAARGRPSRGRRGILAGRQDGLIGVHGAADVRANRAGERVEERPGG